MDANKNSSQHKHMQHTPGAKKRLDDRGAHVVFACVFVIMLLLPLVCMPFASSDASAEKRELAPSPRLMVDGKPNVNVLSEAGNYFADHFAFRSLLVEWDSTLKQKLFLTSSTNNVVVGTNGWLYYSGTLNDYRRTNAMSDRSIRNAATNLSLMQERITGMGKRFVVAIAPNKNALYPQNMPYYQLKGDGKTNAERLLAEMDLRGVNHTDLYKAFGEQDKVLYFERDSHWNDMGALLAYQTIVGQLGSDPVDFTRGGVEQDAHTGDVDGMLHPVSAAPEKQDVFTAVNEYTITNDAAGVEDNYIITAANSQSAADTLIMYRDSFGNNLLKPFAASYKQAVFTKLVPYDMGDKMTAFAHDVVVERTERHLAYFATNPPYMPAPERQIQNGVTERGGNTSVFVQQNGPYLQIEGTLDNSVVGDEDRVYVTVSGEDGNQRAFEAFLVSKSEGSSDDFEGAAQNEDNGHVTGDWGYRAFLPNDVFMETESKEVSVLAVNGNSAYVIAHGSLGDSVG